MSSPTRAPQAELSLRFRQATERAFGAEHLAVDPLLRRSDRADFQANLAMSLGKTLQRPPREVAQAIVSKLEVDDLCQRVEVAGPGFINLTLRNDYLDRLLAGALEDPRLGVGVAEQPETVVIDYPSPNVAKEMHVGHLRTCVIGDCIARVLELLGHRLIRQNHIGDWGTPFGMLIEHLLDLGDLDNAAELSVGELNAFYQAARKKFDGDASFSERSRQRVVMLQAGDAQTLQLWSVLVEASFRHFEQIFGRLGLTVARADARGESFYNPVLPGIAEDLEQRGVAVQGDGALCVFVEGFQNREGDPLPLIVRKNDGGFGYAATDLAALRFRASELGGTRVLYVVGSEQQQHLAMVFAVARLAGYIGPQVRTEHVGFGLILGQDRKKLATRSGESLRLSELLDEGCQRAAALMDEREQQARDKQLARDPNSAFQSELSAEARERLPVAVSLAAIKYADLSSDRIKDYIFDWNRILTFEGNTGPYLQYAHARINSILRKLPAAELASASAFRIQHDRERALALSLLGFEGAVQAVAAGLEPHKLCSYLYELASLFTAFYEACPVLRAETPELRASRLALAELTRRVLERGLGLLGIEAPERM